MAQAERGTIVERLPKPRTEILISGFGGQGVIRMAQIIGRCVINQGLRVTMLKSHGTEMRGGYVRAQLVISPEYVDSPVVENADFFVAFSGPAYKKFSGLCRGQILYDPEMVKEIRHDEPDRHVEIPATALAKEHFSSVLFANMIMLGALTRLGGMDVAVMQGTALEVLPRFHAQNLKALEVGYHLDVVADHAHPKPHMGITSPLPSGARAASEPHARPWRRVWPAHLPLSLNYPEVPVWWLLERNLDRFARRVALRMLDYQQGVEMRSLTYGALWRAVQSLATGFSRLGISKGDRIAFVFPNSPELIIGYYATWLLGAVVVPLNPALTERELAAQAADAIVNLLVATAERAGVMTKVAASLEIPLILAGKNAETPSNGSLSFEELLQSDAQKLSPAPVNPAEDVAILLYTGGTTGKSKGAMLTHRNIVANTIQFAEWYAFEPGAEICIGAIPMFHSGGMAGVMNVPLYAGGTILIFQRFHPVTVAGAVERFRATRLFGVPTMYIALLNHEESRQADYSSLRACRTNAAPLPASVKAAFDNLVGREVLIEGYGLTETSPLTHANPLHRAKPGSIGIPLPDTDAKIIDLETGHDLPTGEAGELVLRGPQVMKAYWNRPQETAQVMAGGWLHTGDIARMDDEGYFIIVDRKKDQINTAGFKVWPREVEEVIYSHPAVQLVAVVGQPDAYRGEVVKACVVLKEEQRGKVSEADMVNFCKQHLAGYKVPRIVELRKGLPVTTTGKMLRRVLREEGTVKKAV